MTSIVTLKIGEPQYSYIPVYNFTYIYIYCVYIVYIYIDININIHVSHTSCCLIGVLLTPVVAQQGTHSCWVFMSQCLLIVFLVVRLISPSFCHILSRYTCVMFMWFCVCVCLSISPYIIRFRLRDGCFLCLIHMLVVIFLVLASFLSETQGRHCQERLGLSQHHGFVRRGCSAVFGTIRFILTQS
jgi:hypothetical protein